MTWLVYVYMMVTLAISVSAGFNVGFLTGLGTFFASAFGLIGVGGVKAALLWYEKSLRWPRLAVGLVLIAVAIWLSNYFSVGFFGHSFSGLEWTGLGFLVGLIGVNKSLAT